jgi:hypothetical protein
MNDFERGYFQGKADVAKVWFSLTEKEILEAVGWESAEAHLKQIPNFPMAKAKQETINSALFIEAKLKEKNA